MNLHWHRRRGLLGLALGSGSARGYAHIGVLAVLAEAGIRPDVVAGTSAGAVIGALYAAGYSAADLEEIVLGFDMRQLLHLAGVRPGRFGMFSLAGFETFLRDLLPATFAELEMPFACVSTNLRDAGMCVLHTEGDLVSAIRASVAVPALIEAVESDGRLLVDGGLVEPVPVDAARALGAKRVIAVSVSAIQVRPVLDGSVIAGSRWLSKLQPGPRGQIAMAAIDIMQHEVAKAALARADVVIEPDVSAYTQIAFQEPAQLIALGREAAAGQLEGLIALSSTR